MFPDWHDELHVPTVGDTVHIVSPHVITVSPPKEHSTFQVSVQPKSADGELSPHAQALASLLRRVHSDTVTFVNKHLLLPSNKPELDELRIDLKNILENYRSSLEYVAHHLADKCVPRPPSERVQFPVARPDEDIASFSNKLDKWFPGLSVNFPAAKDVLISIQGCSGEKWLCELAVLSNFNKHRSLSQLEQKTFHSSVIIYGNVGLRLGELGFSSLNIAPGGIIRLEVRLGQHRDIRGPQLINVDTTTLIDADFGINIVKEERKLYSIPDTTSSVPGLIWTIGKNVFRTIDLLCRHIS